MNNNTKSRFKQTNNKSRKWQVLVSNPRTKQNWMNGGKVAGTGKPCGEYRPKSSFA